MLKKLLLLFVFAAGTAFAQERTPNEILVPASAPVAGKSQAEWSQIWWQWAASFDRDESPVADTTGENCTNGQSGAVWFLAGTYGTKRTVRTCHVPAGKTLFFPLINYVMAPNGNGKLTCESAIASVSRTTANPSALILSVDGKRFENLAVHRQATPACFDLGVLAAGRPRIFPSAANGYYVALYPLPVGTHRIEFGGALPGMLQAVTYELVVE